MQAAAERGHLAELGSVIPQLLIEGIRINSKISLEAIQHATTIAFSEAVKFARICKWQAFHHDRMDQRKDGGVCADAERESQYGDNGEARALAQLARAETDVLQ